MVLMRAPLGERGSYLPTAINVVQCLGWTVFELLVIATAAAALSDELLGFEARWAWTLVFGAAALALGLLGPIGVVRTVLRRVAVWVVPLAVAYLAWWALDGRRPRGGVERGPARAGSRSGRGSTSSSASPSRGSRSPPTTRASRARRAAAFWGTGIGYFVPDALLLGLGAVILLTRDVGDAAALPAAVAAGGLVALLALARADRRRDRRGVRERVLRRRLAPEPRPGGAAAAPGRRSRRPSARSARSRSTLTSFQSFLFLLGSFFVPLFAVLLADWLASGRHYGPEDVFGASRLAAGLVARLDRGLRRLPVALADRPDLVGRAGAAARSARLGDRRDAAELRRLVRARPRRVGRDRARWVRGPPAHEPDRPDRQPLGRPGGGRRPATGRRCLPRCARRRAPRDRRRRRHALRAERPRGRARPARGARVPGDLCRRGGDDGVQLPLRGRPPGHDGRRGRRPVDGRGHRGLGGRGARRREWVLVGALLRSRLRRRSRSRALAAAGSRLAARRPGARARRRTRAARDGRGRRPGAAPPRHRAEAERGGGASSSAAGIDRARSRARRPGGRAHARLAGRRWSPTGDDDGGSTRVPVDGPSTRPARATRSPSSTSTAGSAALAPWRRPGAPRHDRRPS